MPEAPYMDQIGARLSGNLESVPPEYRHLVPDDVQRVRRILGFNVSGAVLDVGCSDGAITRQLVQRSVQVYGMDVNTPATVEGWTFVQWDIREPYPVLAASFDAVYACEVFEHLTASDADAALANLCSWLKPGGDLIVTVPNSQCAAHYTAGCRDRWRWPDHRQAYTPESLHRFLLPHFQAISEVPLYDGEDWQESIFLIVRARGRK